MTTATHATRIDPAAHLAGPRCRWFLGSEEARRLLLDGIGTDLMVSLDGLRWTTYTVCPETGPHGLTGWHLIRAIDSPDGNSDAIAYRLPVTFATCSCPDRLYRCRTKPVCKHMAFLKAALKAIGLVE